LGRRFGVESKGWAAGEGCWLGARVDIHFLESIINSHASAAVVLSSLTEGYHVMTMRTMKSTVETDRKGPSTPAIFAAVVGSSGSEAAVSNNACAAATACWPAWWEFFGGEVCVRRITMRGSFSVLLVVGVTRSRRPPSRARTLLGIRGGARLREESTRSSLLLCVQGGEVWRKLWEARKKKCPPPVKRGGEWNEESSSGTRCVHLCTTQRTHAPRWRRAQPSFSHSHPRRPPPPSPPRADTSPIEPPEPCALLQRSGGRMPPEARLQRLLTFFSLSLFGVAWLLRVKPWVMRGGCFSGCVEMMTCGCSRWECSWL
jgi:hypothetical protein